MGSASSQLVAEGLGSDAMIYTVSQGNEHSNALSTEADAAEGLIGILPVRCQVTVSQKLDGKHKTLTIPDATGVHTLDANSLSTQFVGYLFCDGLTTVVHDDNRFMFHIFV